MVNKTKKIKGINPFNEFWYDNCFMQSIIPVLCFYGVDFREVFGDEEVVYIDEGTKNPKINYSGMEIKLLSAIDLPYFLSKYNMELRCYRRSDNLINSIIHLIDKDIPVIVSIDCFYERQRFDVYQKEHLAHTILIYGYNIVKKEFYIIEHDYVNSTIFREKIISFEEVDEGNLSYAKHIEFDAYMTIIRGTVQQRTKKRANIGYRIDKAKFWLKFSECIKKYQYNDCDFIISNLNRYVLYNQIISRLKKVEINSICQDRNIRNAGVLMS